MRFSVATTNGDQATWRLHADNGRLVAWAGASFASSAEAGRAAALFKQDARHARYDCYQDAGEEWRWRAWAADEPVASSGQSFSCEDEAHSAAERVRVNAGGAGGAEQEETP
jgi:uncharacterized protein YegP (UPF0339 family)